MTDVILMECYFKVLDKVDHDTKELINHKYKPDRICQLKILDKNKLTNN